MHFGTQYLGGNFFLNETIQSCQFPSPDTNQTILEALLASVPILVLIVHVYRTRTILLINCVQSTFNISV